MPKTLTKNSSLAEWPKAQFRPALTSAGLREAQRKTNRRMSDKNRGGVRAGWRGKCTSNLPCQFALTLRGKACLRRIQIAERNEAEREQAGMGRVVARREVQ